MQFLIILKSVGILLKIIVDLGTRCDSRASNFNNFVKGVAHTILRLKFSALVFDVLFRSNLSVQVETNKIILSTVLILRLDWMHFFLRHFKLFEYSDCDSLSVLRRTDSLNTMDLKMCRG